MTVSPPTPTPDPAGRATTAALDPAVTAARARRPRAPSPARVAALQAVREHPCVSVLMTTTPATRMTRADTGALRERVALAGRRL